LKSFSGAAAVHGETPERYLERKVLTRSVWALSVTGGSIGQSLLATGFLLTAEQMGAV